MKTIAEMKPVEILNALRAKDMGVVKALVSHLIKNKIMSLDEIKEILEDRDIKIDKSTIWRWTQ